MDKKKLRYALEMSASVIFALAVWQAVSMALANEILLVSPLSVARRLIELLAEGGSFYSVALFSFLRITAGFLAGLTLGSILAFLASRVRLLKIAFAPFMAAVKAVPVASFIIIALIWLDSSSLSTFISFLMVLPIIYTNILAGFEAIPKEMLEMARVFSIPWYRRLLYIALPSLKPFLISAATVSLGLTWKAGIAAEVIGIPSGSIGERMYQAKIYLETPDLFAWTVAVVLASVIFEKLFVLLIKGCYKLLGR